MKKYLFGLGAMLVGAGLMFVFTHTEVSAKEGWRDENCILHRGTTGVYEYCKVEDLTCVSASILGISRRGVSISCVK